MSTRIPDGILRDSGTLIARARSALSATEERIGGDRLRRAMRLNIITGSGAMMWFMVCAPGSLFNVFFRNHLGASSSQLGIVVAITQLAAVFQLVSIVVYGKLRTRKLYWCVCNTVHRLYGFVLAAVAVAAARGGVPAAGIRIIIIAVAVGWVLTSASSTGWWTWQTDLYPERIRATFFGKRSAILTAAGMISLFLALLAVDMVKSVNVMYVFAAVFAIAGLAGTLDIIFHVLIPEPKRKDHGMKIGWKEFMEPLRNRNFRGYALAIGLWSFAMSIAYPFIPPYITGKEDIGAPTTWLGVMSAITQICVILTVARWLKLCDRFGRRPVVVLTALSPLVWIGYLFLTRDNYMILLPLLAVISGIWGSGYWEGSMQLMLSISPQRNRTAYVAWFTTLTGLVGAGGAVVGGKLYDALKGFSFPAGIITLNSFHVVIVTSVALSLVGVMFIARVKEDGAVGVRKFVRLATGR